MPTKTGRRLASGSSCTRQTSRTGRTNKALEEWCGFDWSGHTLRLADEFEEALRTRKYREAHQQALRHAYEEAGVTGVPMFVIGSEVLTGSQDRETLEAVIEEERKGRENTALR
jgi:protein-disulfide isomerase